LVEKSPETINYWNQLATCYQKTDQLSNAERALLKLIEIDPDAKEHYLNLGIVYGDMGKLSNARRYYIKASEVGGGWALPIYYEGFLYEKSARGCKFDFEAKMVYQLAVDTYRKALKMDSSLTQARDRISALATSVPTQEDYFFRGYKSGQVLPIKGECFDWIGKSVTVP
jgi:tetratricopeptide (TPR) repeat protein